MTCTVSSVWSFNKMADSLKSHTTSLFTYIYSCKSHEIITISPNSSKRRFIREWKVNRSTGIGVLYKVIWCNNCWQIENGSTSTLLLLRGDWSIVEKKLIWCMCFCINKATGECVYVLWNIIYYIISILDLLALGNYANSHYKQDWTI